jgi:flagellar biosynthesis/type III secretory pathway chaperone
MTIKELILQELDRASDEELQRFWQSLQQIRHGQPQINQHNEAFWQAYLESEQEYEEVYQRLADS